MVMEGNDRKGYFAFISYKREDAKWADWLQHELEHYRLPSNLNGREDLPKSIRPSCLQGHLGAESHMPSSPDPGGSGGLQISHRHLFPAFCQVRMGQQGGGDLCRHG